MRHFTLGQVVVMTEDALENYGAQWAGVHLFIVKISKNTEDHPGYDDGVAPMWLYDLKRFDNNEYLPNSLYDWELRRG